MEVFRFSKNVWGQDMLVGMSWDPLWVPVAAAFACIAAYQLVRLVLRRSRVALATTSGSAAEDIRHKWPDRSFHWAMAALVIVLLGTASLPVLGARFDWVPIH